MSNIEDGALYVNCERLKDYFAKKSMFFFLSSFFFTNTGNSWDSRERGDHLYSSLLFPTADEPADR